MRVFPHLRSSVGREALMYADGVTELIMGIRAHPDAPAQKSPQSTNGDRQQGDTMPLCI